MDKDQQREVHPDYVIIELPWEIYEELNGIALIEHRRFEEILAESFRLEKFYHDLKQQKGKLLAKVHGEIRYVVRK